MSNFSIEVAFKYDGTKIFEKDLILTDEIKSFNFVFKNDHYSISRETGEWILVKTKQNQSFNMKNIAIPFENQISKEIVINIDDELKIILSQKFNINL